MKNIYSLFIGFRKLGEFTSIREAKQFARSTKLTGIFNLIGENYRDSWYVFKSEIKDNDNQGYNRQDHSCDKSELGYQAMQIMSKQSIYNGFGAYSRRKSHFYTPTA